MSGASIAFYSKYFHPKEEEGVKILKNKSQDKSGAPPITSSDAGLQ
jgi:hypothetical protein